jgi:hypothetical protein
MSSRLALCFMALISSLVRAQALTVDPWSGIQFLMGEWVSTSGGGAPGEAVAGGFRFALELDGRIATRHGHSEYAPKPGEKEGVKHSDLLIVFPTPTGLRATYWDNEGHIIQYSIKTEASRATFESDAAAPGPRFKLVYEAQSDGLAISFFIAPPGGSYQPYVKGVARRK